MKVGFQKFIATIVSVCLICGLSSSSHAAVISNDDNLGVNLYYENLMREQEVAIAADICLESSFPKNDQGTVIYPENYGGKYIDGSNLIINLTSISDDDCCWYETVLQKFKGHYSFNLVDHSYMDLCTHQKLVTENLCKFGVDVLESAVQQRDNCVYIGVDEKQVAFTRSMIRNEMSVTNKGTNNLPNFEVCGVETETPLTSITGGTTELYNASTDKKISAGICGTYQGNAALLTCGHINQSLGDTIRLNSSSGALVGTVVNHNYYDGGTGDYEIIRVVNGIETTNTIANQYSVKGTYPNPSQGVIVKYYGKNSGYGYGEVTNTNLTVSQTIGNNETISIQGLSRVKITYGSCVDGDSGSPFFTSSSYSYTLFAGILSSRVTINNELYVSFTPWTKISGSGFVVSTN